MYDKICEVTLLGNIKMVNVSTLLLIVNHNVRYLIDQVSEFFKALDQAPTLL